MPALIQNNKILAVEGRWPYGKQIIHKGYPFTCFTWSMQTWTICKELHIPDLPDMLAAYTWGYSLYKPYSHQIVTTDFLIRNPKSFCWNEAGTGKTASVIWAYDYLVQQKVFKKILIVCPLSTARAVWDMEFFKIIPYPTRSILIGTKAKRVRVLATGADIIITNHDGIKVMFHELMEWAPDLIVIDEHTAFKNQRTDRWKAVNILCSKAQFIWALSGTPMPQAPTDLYAPARIICPDSVGRSFIRFRDLTMNQVSMYKWLPKKNFEEILKPIIQPVIRFKRDDCLDLPPVVHQLYEVEFSKKQELSYKKLRKDATVMVDGGEINAVNEGVMRSKLLQCCGGYVYTSGTECDRVTVSLNPTPRLEAVRDLVADSSRGVLIFIPFRHAIAALYEYLKGDYSVMTITGDTPEKQRPKIFNKFQDGEIKVIIAHPRTMAHGVTLTAADTVIWYIVTSDNELYEQANSRINRIGQEHKMRVVHLVSTPLERNVLVRLEQKRSMQGVLLETFGEKQEK